MLEAGGKSNTGVKTKTWWEVMLPQKIWKAEMIKSHPDGYLAFWIIDHKATSF